MQEPNEYTRNCKKKIHLGDFLNFYHLAYLNYLFDAFFLNKYIRLDKLFC
jgi:hypothetical protein